MKRGDVVTVAATEDYDKPRPVDDRDIARLNVALAFVMGLAD